ncbi:MAG: SDR family NAD(P)-dependent oxidoreductase, partial [Phaeodactylibacter sp.]|nr:SDR family NAD(P)-dependent oxidoreductase [Phaeodactylibacter sp.]
EEEEEEEVVEEEEEEEMPVGEQGPIPDAVEEALAYFGQGRVEEGLAIMAQATEEQPDNYYLRYHYALMLAQKKQDYSSARLELAPVLKAETENEDALFLMGELDELLGDFANAYNHYQQLSTLNPEYPNAFYRLGMITSAHFRDKKKEAATYFKKAARLDPANADAPYHYALLLLEAFDKPKKAIKFLKATLETDPHHPFANYDMALAYHQMGEREKARKAYARAIEANPELQTPENDLAFNPPKEAAASSIRASFGLDTIEALKNSINHLEELLKAREDEALLLREELEEKAEEVRAISEAQAVVEAEQQPAIDQTVFITGATSGIGKATAERFARAGYRVIITGRRADRLAELKAQLEEDHDADILAIEFDVRDEQAAHEAVGALHGKWKDIDILINNAGKAKGLAPIHEGKLEHWEEMIDTNIKGLLYMTRAISPMMVARKSGHIINICSTAGKEVYPNGNVYCATKYAVDALTKGMRLDLHQHNVRVSMVSPAHVEETEFALVRFDGDQDKAQIYNDFKPLNSMDVAESLYFIATQPPHVNILDIVLQGTQQASSLVIDRSGRELYEEEED